jgi:hypothetical protein
MVEIAELMQRVFPSGLSQKQQRLQVAAQLGDGTIPNVRFVFSDMHP